MSIWSYYEAPRRQTLDGFVDPVDLPTSIRVIAPPNARSSHALAGALCRSLGAVRDLQTNRVGETLMLSNASAWALAVGVTDVYVAVAEDLTRPAVFDMIDFAGRIGAHLHMVFSFGQVHIHADTVNEVGFESRPFTDLPAVLRDPTPTTPFAVAEQPDPALLDVVVPDDYWTTYRAAYRSLLPPDQAAALDVIYLNSYTTARDSTATTPEDVAALTGSLWQRFGLTNAVRVTVTRAVQAAMFRNGLLVRIDLGPFTRLVQQRHVNLMTERNYNDLRGYMHPWRAAATVLHAFHVSTETTLALRALDVAPDGTIPLLGIDLPDGARTILAAQRWHQLITQDADPPLFNQRPHGLRQGIRAVVADLDLPLIAYWRTLKEDKGRTNIGIRVEAFA